MEIKTDGVLFDYLGTDIKVGKPENDPPAPSEPPADPADPAVAQKLEELSGKSPEELSDEDKAFLEANKPKDPPNPDDPPTDPSTDGGDDDGDDELTDEQIQELRDKPEEELTDEEKAILAEIDKPFIAQLSEAVGFTPAEGKEYSDDSEGLQEFARDYASALTQKELDGFMEQNPEVFEFYEARKAGMTADQYMQKLGGYEIALTNITEETPETIQEEVLRTSYAYKGYEREDIEILVQKAKDEGKLLEEATKGGKHVQKAYKDEMAQIKAQNEAQEKAELAKRKEFWDNATAAIKDGNLGGAIIPDNEKDEFLKYLTVRGEDGLTAKDKKRASLTPKDIMKIEWAIYKDFKGIGPSSASKKLSFNDLGSKGNRQQRLGNDGKPAGGPPKSISLKEMAKKLKDMEARAK